MEIPIGFDHVRDGRREWLVRANLRESVSTVIRDAFTTFSDYAATPVPGGRSAVLTIRLDTITVAVRRYRRGGLPARLLSDTYLWCGGPTRPFRELTVTESLRQRGVPVVEPIAAVVDWTGWGRYRGALITRWMEQASSLWEFLRARPSDDRRREALLASHVAIARLHSEGAAHADLNLNNILIRDGQAWLLDFDRGCLRATLAKQRRALARLRRSARKLDPGGTLLSAADLELITGATAAG